MAAALYKFQYASNLAMPQEFKKGITKKHVELFGGDESSIYFTFNDVRRYTSSDAGSEEKTQIDVLRIHLPLDTSAQESDIASLIEEVGRLWRARMQELEEQENWGGGGSPEKVDYNKMTLGPVFVLKDLASFQETA